MGKRGKKSLFEGHAEEYEREMRVSKVRVGGAIRTRIQDTGAPV